MPEARASLAREFLAAARALATMVAGTRLPIAFETALEDSSLPPASRTAARAFTFDATRELGRIQALASRLNARPPAPTVAALQAVALSQLINGSRPPAIVVDQAVIAAKIDAQTRGAAPFLNATLRRFGREREAMLAAVADDPVARWNHPSWWIERLQAEQPAHWAAVLTVDNESAPMTLRVNRRRTAVEDYQRMLREAGITSRRIGPVAIALDRPVDVGRLPGFRDGWCSVQDAGAQLAAPLLDVQPGQRVLDACAAPGGKTGHLAELADCRLTALDVDPARLQRVGDAMSRLGTKADLIAADATRLDAWWDGEPFDRILVDAPCSASGIVRRHPDVRWLRRRSDPATFGGQQVQLVEALWPALRPGGKLLLATCSIFRSEGAEVMERLLTSLENARRLTIEWQWSTQDAAEPVSLLLPMAEPERDHDGFFYGLLTKLS